MKKTLAGAVGALALLSAQMLAVAPAAAVVPGPVTIDFTDEVAGAKPNGYSPAGAGGVTFTDTLGANLSVD